MRSFKIFDWIKYISKTKKIWKDKDERTECQTTCQLFPLKKINKKKYSFNKNNKNECDIFMKRMLEKHLVSLYTALTDTHAHYFWRMYFANIEESMRVI